MAYYLDPKNDLVFKRIFGEHPDLLISFLNALLPLEQDGFINSLEYLTPELVPENPAKKFSIVDVRCKDNRGRYFIVEMQMEWNSSFLNRMVFNTSKVFVNQMVVNENYNSLAPVYSLGILNKNFEHKTAEFYHRYRLQNPNNPDEILPGLEFVLIELPKFVPEKLADRKMAVLWLRFLKEVHEQNAQVSEELMENKDIRKAMDMCEKGGFTPEELALYEKYQDAIRTEKRSS
jgi:predicted transposase/invertase (TIGR01784 family)